MLSLPPRRSGPPRQPVCDGPYCLRLHGCRLGLRGYHFRGHLCVRLRYGLETRPHPMDEAVERLQKVGFPSPCSPSYRALALPLVGFPPTEHASLRWTHHRTCPSLGIRLSILEFLLSVALAGDFRNCPQCLTCSCRQHSRVLTLEYLWPLGLSPFPSAWGFRLCYHSFYLGRSSTCWLLHPLQVNVGYYGDAVPIQVSALKQNTSLGNPAFQHE